MGLAQNSIFYNGINLALYNEIIQVHTETSIVSLKSLYFLLHFSAIDTCSRQIKSAPSKRDLATSLVFGGSIVEGRKYPWAGAYFHNEDFRCGGNLGKHVLLG
jgi:hypothetical protein